MTIKYKLVTIVMLACFVGLIVAGVAFIGWEQNMLRTRMVNNLSTRAEMVAENCRASLAFQDNKDAEKTLQALRVDSSVIFGSVYDNQDKLFAAFYRDDNKIKVLPTKPKKSGFSFSDGLLTVYSPIILDNERIGIVCMQSDLESIHETLNRSVQIIVAVICISLLAVFLVSSRLQAIISKPILNLAELAKTVSEKKNYSTRAVKQSNDEVGSLIDAFNGMLEQIQKRDSELLFAKEGLEVKVRERTTELSKANEQLTSEIAERKQAQDRLRESEEKHRLIFDKANDSIFLMDNDKFIACNDKTLELFACTREQILYKEPYLFSPPTQPDGRSSTEKALEKINAALAGQPQQFEWVHSRYDGTKFDAEVTLNSLILKGKPHILAIVRDITERKRAERIIKESKQMLQVVMDNIPQSIFWKDRNLTYLGCNTNFARDTGLNDPKAVVGKTDYDLAWKKEESDFYRECDHKVMESDMPQYHIIETQQQASGKQAWLDTNKIPLHDADGKVVGIIGTYEDITERKKAEEQLQKLNKDLAEAVGKLEEANTELKNFVYIASHDMREPLRKIAAFGAMLGTSLEGKISPDDAENLQFMIDGAQRMTKMIEGLLVYSRVSTKAQVAQTVELNEIVKQLQQLELSVLIEEKHVTIEVPQPLPCVEVDPVQIRQLMQNLIANGVKYQKKDNIPHISITSKPAADGMVRIEVTDNGIGIKPEYQGAIFAMFKRLHTRDEYEGTGIGLAVCKKIVERHGGKIGIESQPDKGSTFWFTVPGAEKPVTAETESKSLV